MEYRGKATVVKATVVLVLLITLVSIGTALHKSNDFNLQADQRVNYGSTISLQMDCFRKDGTACKTITYTAEACGGKFKSFSQTGSPGIPATFACSTGSNDLTVYEDVSGHKVAEHEFNVKPESMKPNEGKYLVVSMNYNKNKRLLHFFLTNDGDWRGTGVDSASGDEPRLLISEKDGVLDLNGNDVSSYSVANGVVLGQNDNLDKITDGGVISTVSGSLPSNGNPLEVKELDFGSYDKNLRTPGKKIGYSPSSFTPVHTDGAYRPDGQILVGPNKFHICRGSKAGASVKTNTGTFRCVVPADSDSGKWDRITSSTVKLEVKGSWGSFTREPMKGEKVEYQVIFRPISSNPSNVEISLEPENNVGKSLDAKGCEGNTGTTIDGQYCKLTLSHTFKKDKKMDLVARMRVNGKLKGDTPDRTVDVKSNTCPKALVGGLGDKKKVYYGKTQSGGESPEGTDCSYKNVQDYPSYVNPWKPSVFYCKLNSGGDRTEFAKNGDTRNQLQKELASEYCKNQEDYQNSGFVNSQLSHVKLPVVQYYVPEKMVPSVTNGVTAEKTTKYWDNDRGRDGDMKGWDVPNALTRHSNLHGVEDNFADTSKTVSESNYPNTKDTDESGNTVYYPTKHNNDAYSLGGAKLEKDYDYLKWKNYWTAVNVNAPGKDRVQSQSNGKASDSSTYEYGFAPKCQANLQLQHQQDVGWICSGEPTFTQQIFMPNLNPDQVSGVTVGFHIMPYLFNKFSDTGQASFFQGLEDSRFKDNPDSQNRVKEIEAVCWAGGKSVGYGLLSSTRFTAQVVPSNGDMIGGSVNNPVPVTGKIDMGTSTESYTCKWALISGSGTFVKPGTVQRVRSQVEQKSDYSSVSDFAKSRGYNSDIAGFPTSYNKSMNVNLFKQVSNEWASQGIKVDRSVGLCDFDAKELIPSGANC